MGLKSKQVLSDDDISTSTKNHDQEQQPLDCPRCGSGNTKFCYYNNYNRSQPRHFCKACKRYWTKGGTLRNVPVGCGRKNKRLKTFNSAKTTTTNPITCSTANGNSDHQDYCINLHLPAQEGLKAVTDNDEKNISDFLIEAFNDSTSLQDGSQNLSFSGGLGSFHSGGLGSFHFNGNPSPIPGMYESIELSSSITENNSSSIFCQPLQGSDASGGDHEFINWWNLNDLDTLISADDLNYVPWDDDAGEEINR